MDTKAMVMQKLGIAKIGKKVKFKDYDGSHINVGDEVVMEVKRIDGSMDFVMGRYNAAHKLYRVAYDANMRGGRIKEIVSVYAGS